MRNIDFSPEVDKAQKLCALRHLVVKKCKGLRVSTSLIKRKARQLGIHCPLSVTLDQALALLQEADEAYSVLKKNAPSLRHEFLRDRASNRTGTVSINEQKAAKRLLTQERQ
jgi:hypothetical protein